MLLEVHCHVHRSPAPRDDQRKLLVAFTRSLPLATLLIIAHLADFRFGYLASTFSVRPPQNPKDLGFRVFSPFALRWCRPFGLKTPALCRTGNHDLPAGWLAALDRRIYRERSKENQIKPELLNRGLFSFCHGKARRRCPWFNPGICNSSQQLHKVTKNNY